MTGSIYRYTFSDEFMQSLSNFSKIHQFDDRYMFKEQWDKWVHNNELVQTEVDRLQDLNYKGDVIDKMFKSARYYFRKKELLNKDSDVNNYINNEEQENQNRRAYIRLDKKFLTIIDTHIVRNCTKDSYSPAKGYNEFCIQNQTYLLEMIKNIINNPDIILDADELGFKN